MKITNNPLIQPVYTVVDPEGRILSKEAKIIKYTCCFIYFILFVIAAYFGLKHLVRGTCQTKKYTKGEVYYCTRGRTCTSIWRKNNLDATIVCNVTDFHETMTLLNTSDYNGRKFDPFYEIQIKTDKSWDAKNEQKEVIKYYNQIYGNQDDTNDVYKTTYKYYPTYTTSVKAGDYDTTYTYYNTRYKAKPTLFTTKYYSYYNHYDKAKNTKQLVYAYHYSYTTTYCEGPEIV